jgi:hypothetical protein
MLPCCGDMRPVRAFCNQRTAGLLFGAPGGRLPGFATERYNKDFPCGPVAQLGARMNGIHEVTGSIPVWSTNLTSLRSFDWRPIPGSGSCVGRFASDS